MNTQDSTTTTPPPTPDIDVRMIEVALVGVGKRRRKLSLPDVKKLASSISDVGLVNPVTVRVVGDGYELVAGRHRLEAARDLGWRTIPAIVVDLDDVDRALLELDENLVRNELTTLVRAEHVSERKKIYLLKYPQTKRGTAGGKASRGATSETVSFVQDTAVKTGRTVRSVQQDVQIGEGIPEDVRDVLHQSAIADATTDLMALARLPEEVQREIVETVDLSSKSEIREAAQAHHPSRARSERAGEGDGGGGEGTTASPAPKPARLLPSKRPLARTVGRRASTSPDGEPIIQIELTVETFARTIIDSFTPDQKDELIRLLEIDRQDVKRRQIGRPESDVA